MRKQIALLVAVAGFATISAQAQDYCSGYTITLNTSETTSGNYVMSQFQGDFVIPQFQMASADTVTTVPEPSTLALCAIGFAGLTIARRSFRQRRS